MSCYNPNPDCKCRQCKGTTSQSKAAMPKPKKKRMRTSSLKAKGRRACQELAQALYAAAPTLQPGDIEVTSSGATGEDLKLSPAARQIYPFAIEVKNQEALNIWASLDQAKSHVLQRQVYPLLAFKRNKSEMYVAMSLADFLALLSRQEKS